MFPANYRRLRRLLAVLFVAFAVLVPLSQRALRQEIAILDADEMLLRGDLEAAREAYRDLTAWGHLSSDAKAGLAAGRALGGDELAFVEIGQLDRASLQRLPLPLLLRGSLQDGRPEGTLALTRLARRAELRSVDLYRAAALVELGRAAEVGKTVHARGAFADRLNAALDLHDRGIRTIVRDRRGVSIGIVDPEGELHLDESVDPLLVPRYLIEELERTPREGVLRLSIDLDLSKKALQALRYHQGSIVVLDSWTGDILVAVSDKRSWRRGGTPAFEERREPASISKLITTTAALRAGLDPDEEISHLRCNGAVRYDGEYVWCPSRGGRLRSLDRALAKSCNVAFAELGQKVGRQGVVDELRRYGFGASVDLGDGLESGHILHARGNQRQLADLSIGLEETDVTPLHAALIASVFANDGIMPRARLVTATDGPLGLSPRPFDVPRGRRVIDPSWIPQMTQAMEAVVSAGGTAAKVAPEGYPVFMKTGTGAQYPYGYHVNYIGVGPQSRPRLAFAVRITRKKSSRSARQAGYDSTRRLLRALRDLPALEGNDLDLKLAEGAPDRGSSPTTLARTYGVVVASTPG